MKKITSDQEAWELLSRLVSTAEVPDVEFEGWPVLDIKLKGDDYKGSLNSGQMAALVQLEHVFGRAYSVVAHGAYDKRRLRADEEDELKFSTKVKEGSSILETDFSPLVQAFSGAVAAHPQLAIITALIIGLAMVSKPVIMKHYETRAKQIDAEEKNALINAMKGDRDDAEKNRTLDRAIAKVSKTYPQFAQILPQARNAFWRFASSSADADSLSIEGIEFSQEDLEVLSSRRSRRASDVQEITSNFRITYVKKAGAGFVIGLEGTQMVLGAVFKKPHLTDAKIKKLMGLMAAGKSVDAKLEVRVVDKAHMSGRLISFKVRG
jgi:hypothetical protein